MDHVLFETKWNALNTATRFALRTYARNPTEKNNCYMTGYLACADDMGLIDASYWLAVINDATATNELLYMEMGVR